VQHTHTHTHTHRRAAHAHTHTCSVRGAANCFSVSSSRRWATEGIWLAKLVMAIMSAKSRRMVSATQGCLTFTATTWPAGKPAHRCEGVLQFYVVGRAGGCLLSPPPLGQQGSLHTGVRGSCSFMSLIVQVGAYFHRHHLAGRKSEK